MPPIRNLPMPIKPMKTERTHEENQERAYIAASRRSDRSLEARIESARRASEIHKRRTGRSLRVREEDVVNEEMYEEEDDDLPQQYRRLTAHLATSNTEFDRRLRAYITNQVAMRSAFGQAATAGGWQNDQAFPISNPFMNPANMSSSFPLSFAPNTMPSPMTPSQPSVRQSPYPTQQDSGQPRSHNRSQSAAVPSHISPYPSRPSKSPLASPMGNSHDRRPSLPAQSPHGFAQSGSPGQTPLALSPDQSFLHGQSQNVSHQQRHNSMAMGNTSLGPLTSTLPLESQQLLAGGSFFNFQDPFSSMTTTDMDLKHPHQPYAFNGNPNSIALDAGLDQTLWGYNGGGNNFEESMFTDTTTDFSPFDQTALNFSSPNAGYSSGHVTPGLGKEEWDSFLHGDAFEDSTVA